MKSSTCWNHWIGQIQPKSNWLFPPVKKVNQNCTLKGYSLLCKYLTKRKEFNRKRIATIDLNLIYVNSSEYMQTVQKCILFGEVWMEKVNNEKTGTRQGRNGWSRRPQRGTSGDRRRAYTYIQHCITDRDHGYTSYRELQTTTNCTINDDSKRVRTWSTKMFFL